MPRWGAERRARPLHEVPVASVLRKGEGERTRAASLFDAARWCASRRSASLLLREEFFGMLLGLAFFGVGKARVRRGIATTKRLVIAGLDPLLVTTGLDPLVHGAWQTTHGSTWHAASQHGPPGQARW